MAIAPATPAGLAKSRLQGISDLRRSCSDRALSVPVRRTPNTRFTTEEEGRTMKKTTFSIAAVVAFGLAACGGQQDQDRIGRPEGPATQTSPGATTPGASVPGAAGPGTTGPGMAPGGPGATGTPGTMQQDTLMGQPGTGTAPGTTGGAGRP
jgi:hypothetical protein